MAYETKPDTGTLFKNDKKTTDQHPNAKGSAFIDGIEYWVSAWTNEVKSGDRQGEKYQALKFDRKEKQAAAPRAQAASNDSDDDIPW